MPVSYTHLDVYKRQLFAGGAGAERGGGRHRDAAFRFRQCHGAYILWDVGGYLGGDHQLHFPHFCSH